MFINNHILSKPSVLGNRRGGKKILAVRNVGKKVSTCMYLSTLVV